MELEDFMGGYLPHKIRVCKKTKYSKTYPKSKIEARALRIRTRTGINRLRQDLWYHSFLHTPKTQKLNKLQNSKCTHTEAPKVKMHTHTEISKCYIKVKDFMGGAPPLEIFYTPIFYGGCTPPLEIFIRQYFMGGAPPRIWVCKMMSRLSKSSTISLQKYNNYRKCFKMS